MKFKEVYKMVSSGWKPSALVEGGKLTTSAGTLYQVHEAVARQQENVRQQREGLLKCLFGSKKAISGRIAKITSSEYECSKHAPFSGFLGSDRVAKKAATVTDLHEKLLLVQKRLGTVK